MYYFAVISCTECIASCQKIMSSPEEICDFLHIFHCGGKLLFSEIN